MAVTWTSGYGIKEAEPFVEWGLQGEAQIRSPAGTLTFSRNSMCGLLFFLDSRIYFNFWDPSDDPELNHKRVESSSFEMCYF